MLVINIYVAVAGIDVQGQPDGIYAWIRLLFQPLFIWLALWTTGALGALTRHATPEVIAEDRPVTVR
jgi:hypothetical protein